MDIWWAMKPRKCAVFCSSDFTTNTDHETETDSQDDIAMDSDSSDDLRLAIDDEEDSSDYESETISAFGKTWQFYLNYYFNF